MRYNVHKKLQTSELIKAQRTANGEDPLPPNTLCGKCADNAVTRVFGTPMCAAHAVSALKLDRKG